MANVRMKAVVVDTSHHRLRRAIQPQPTTRENENAAAMMGVNRGAACWPPMQQASFMHLLLSDVRAVKLSRLLEQLSAYYHACTVNGVGDEAVIVGKIYELACCLRNGGDSWLDFCRQPEWAEKRPSPKFEKPDEALAHVFKLVCDHKARAGQKAPAEIVVALRIMWAAGASSEEVVAAIRGAGSIAAMASLERRRKRAEKTDPERPVSIVVKRPTVAKRLEAAAVGEAIRLKVIKRAGGKTPVFEVLHVRKAKTREVSPPS